MRTRINKHFTGLWLPSDFLKLWSAQTTSRIGTQVTLLAIPVMAVAILDASPFKMGVLAAISTLPALIFGLHAGAWIDRHKRQPLLVASDLLRALLLVSIPLAYYLDVLSMSQLYLVVFLFGFLSLIFEVAYRSYLPTLIHRSQLIEGNSKLELSRAGSELVGPALGGLLIRLLTAPVAILVDSVSYLISAIFLQKIQRSELSLIEKTPSTMWSEIRVGLISLYTNPVMKVLAGCAMTVWLFNSGIEAVFILYVLRELDIGPGLLGLIFTAGGIGFLAGPVLSNRLSQHMNARFTLVFGIVLIGCSDLLIPLAGGPFLLVIIMLTGAQFFFGVGYTIFSILRVSIQQTTMPDDLQGRTHATMIVLLGSGALIGGLAGGAIAEIIGTRVTLLLAAIGELTAVAWMFRAPPGMALNSTNVVESGG